MECTLFLKIIDGSLEMCLLDQSSGSHVYTLACANNQKRLPNHQITPNPFIKFAFTLSYGDLRQQDGQCAVHLVTKQIGDDYVAPFL